MTGGRDGSGRGTGNGSTPPPEQAEGRRAAELRDDARRAAAAAALREEEALEQREALASAPPRPSAQDPDASLLEVARALLGAAQDAAASAGASVGAFGALVKADVALARASLVSGVVLGSLAAVAGVTSWLLLVWLLVLGLEHAGLPRWGAVGCAAALTLVLAGIAAAVALHRLRGTRLAATRRQWAMLRHGERPT